jgi:molybdopterin molybdotransferase
MESIPFEQARERILTRVSPLTEIETVPVTMALGRVLAASVIAPYNVPDSDVSSMDGYAVHFGGLSREEHTVLKVVADLPAGERPDQIVGQGEAVCVIAGAPVPEGCDCVVPQEAAQREDDQVTVPPGQALGRNIRRAGEEFAAGDRIFAPGHRLTPADIGMLSSLDLVEVPVYRRLRAAVVFTGSDVVYGPNHHALATMLRELGAELLDLGTIHEQLRNIAGALRRGAAEADVVLTSGSVSVSSLGQVMEVIDELGTVDFLRVNMRPGKSLAQGRIGKAEFFDLPGDPVSVTAAFLLLVRPALLTMMGCEPESQQRLRVPYRGSPIDKQHAQLEFLQGVLCHDGEESWVERSGKQGVGIAGCLSRVKAFIQLPEEPQALAEGDLVTVLPIEY